MKALVLASGSGSRLLPLTEKVPKCLLAVGSKSILQRQIELLDEVGIDEVIVTTGYLHHMVEEWLQDHPDIQRKVITVYNDRFAETNYIYSMWLAKDLLHGEYLIIHGDLIIEPALLMRLVDQDPGNYVLIDAESPPPDKDFKAMISNGKVMRIAVDVSGEGAFFCAPVYRLQPYALAHWMGSIGRYVGKGLVGCYAEDALNAVISEIDLQPLYYCDSICMEIDTIDDLQKARGLLE